MGIHQVRFGTVYHVGNKPLTDAAFNLLRRRPSTDDATKEIETDREQPTTGPFQLFEDPTLESDHFVATGNTHVPQLIRLQEEVRRANDQRDAGPHWNQQHLTNLVNHAEQNFRNWLNSNRKELPADIKQVQDQSETTSRAHSASRREDSPEPEGSHRLQESGPRRNPGRAARRGGPR
jgi:hypothetical protein